MCLCVRVYVWELEHTHKHTHTETYIYNGHVDKTSFSHDYKYYLQLISPHVL